MTSITEIESLKVKHIFALATAELSCKFEHINIIGLSIVPEMYGYNGDPDSLQYIQKVTFTIYAKEYEEEEKLYHYGMYWDCEEEMFINFEELDCRSLDDEFIQ